MPLFDGIQPLGLGGRVDSGVSGDDWRRGGRSLASETGRGSL